ncbi:hypothetical protein EEB14_32995 [Rhodococcus sp. WS4]|nr:hypothetical protein EEB14_32995 [Rhodococcus sp. WS4]
MDPVGHSSRVVLETMGSGPHCRRVRRGSAASVAEGIATASNGSDSGGSIRIPASLNGVVGLQSSAGRRLSNRHTATTRVATFTAGDLSHVRPLTLPGCSAAWTRRPGRCVVGRSTS